MKILEQNIFLTKEIKGWFKKYAHGVLSLHEHAAEKDSQVNGH